MLSTLLFAFAALASSVAAAPTPTHVSRPLELVSRTTQSTQSILSDLEDLKISLLNMTEFLEPAGNFTNTNTNYAYDTAAAAAPASLASNITAAASRISIDPSAIAVPQNAQQIVDAFTSVGSSKSSTASPAEAPF